MIVVDDDDDDVNLKFYISLCLGVFVTKKLGDEVRSLRRRQDGVTIIDHLRGRFMSACWLDGCTTSKLWRQGRCRRSDGGGGGFSTNIELSGGIRKPTKRKKERGEELERKVLTALVDTTAPSTSTRSLGKDFSWELAAPISNEKGEDSPQQPNPTQQKTSK